MSDLLNMTYINCLPQPFTAVLYGGDEWPLYDICVETGIVRIDVCGMLEIKHIGDIKIFRDMDGVNHDPDDFYLEEVEK